MKSKHFSKEINNKNPGRGQNIQSVPARLMEHRMDKGLL
jgi:hypothetical protein